MIFSIGIVYNKVKYISELYIMAEKMQEYWKDEPVIFFQNVRSFILMSLEKHGWILYRITALVIMRVNHTILSLGR